MRAAEAWSRLPKADCRSLKGRCPGGRHLAPSLSHPTANRLPL